MPVDLVSSIGSNVYDETKATQTTAVANGYDMDLDDFWQLLAASLKYQDPTSPMTNTEMMDQVTQMSSMSTMSALSDAISNFGVVINNLSEVTLSTYSMGLMGQEVTVATTDKEGKVTGEVKGTVTGVDLTSQSVYVNGVPYALSQVMSVGNVSKSSDDDD